MDSNLTPSLNKEPGAAKQKSENAFTRALKRIFVFNIGYKALAVILSAVIWIITVGLS